MNDDLIIKLKGIDEATEAFKNLAKAFRKLPWYIRLWFDIRSRIDEIFHSDLYE